MKKVTIIIAIIIAFILAATPAFAQKSVSDLKTSYVKSYHTVTVTNLQMFKGSCELSGQFIDQQGEKTFWVKNAILKANDKVLLNMGLTLQSDNVQTTAQIPAIYGYIVEITGDNMLSLWITDENGIRNSDEIIVNIKNDEAFVHTAGW